LGKQYLGLELKFGKTILRVRVKVWEKQYLGLGLKFGERILRIRVKVWENNTQD
jgi:hypothetical protein